MRTRIKLVATGVALGALASLVSLPSIAKSDNPTSPSNPVRTTAGAQTAAPVADTPATTATVKPVAKTVAAKPAPAATPTYSVNWSATTPAYSQGSLLGGLACAPTALAMVTAHFHTQNPALGMRTPDQFVANLAPGEFLAGQGVPYPYLARQLADLGYTNVTGHMGASQAELAQALQAGPMIATTGADTRGRAGSHSLVVVAIANDRSSVIVNDPATGQRTTMSWAAFDRIWASGSRGVLYVRP